MKTILTFAFLICLFLAPQVKAQNKWLTKTGSITFIGSKDTFEPIKATNNKVTAVYDQKSKKLAALAIVKGFRFKVALMEEHFNENYAESQRYPKAKFVTQLKNDPFEGNNSQTIICEGKLEFHGVINTVKVPLTFKKEDNKIGVSGSFKVKPEDYKIKIPSIVKNKIASEIEINVSFELNKK